MDQPLTLSVLKNINFELQRSEMVAIVGVSGSGKSTLMHIIGFLDHCTTGHYFFNNQDVSHLTENELAKIRNQKIGFVFQSFFLLPRLNALQNVMLPLSYRGIDRIAAKQQGLAMLERVGVHAFATHYPNQLSGGQQQRVAIARALIGNPELILADEPTGSLDAKTGQEIMDLFLQLNQQEQRTIIIVTHDRDISQQCQRIVTLKDGSIYGNRISMG
ncbi:MAG: macrolide ABC transporter ATP-binding protein [Gammaproteobacteria bacterium RIFCSPHIGHO2_12_FULL_41_20]|nr:MAG: macrolide ABC transporter ATP-binding protein [Gammaproteobacteria bacterium RIFCSPHIGHO2_12_FULL_41_20]